MAMGADVQPSVQSRHTPRPAPPLVLTILTILVLSLSSQCAAAPLQCGVASAVFSTCPSCLNTAVKTGALKFWWSWGTKTELDTTALGPELADLAQKLFVPMLWGQGNPPSDDFLSSGSQYVMGFNEPDQVRTCYQTLLPLSRARS